MPAATSGAGGRQPANTNAHIASESLRPGSQATFTAMLRLDHNNRAAGQIAKTGKAVASIEKLAVGQPLSHHVRRLPLRHHRCPVCQDMINDEEWNRNVFLPTVGKRGAAIIAARGVSLPLPPQPTLPSTTCATGPWAPTASGSPWAFLPTANTAFPLKPCSATRHLRRRRIQDRRRSADLRILPGVHQQDPWPNSKAKKTVSSTCCNQSVTRCRACCERCWFDPPRLHPA